ncbi:glycosyltransferase family 2 protein [Hoeflea sp. Naph1]|uniref:glycosyltransferase family 2 protein n=1 Tax=Hoeflea sp. Naph1 TaxID=3388653 RepID=UPI00398FAECF
MVHLTICLPTRNRQAYCIKTIEALAQNSGDDFEIIVADNSDDPAPLADYFAQSLHDSRFRLMAPGGAVLPMVDNWERAVSHANGRWISVIGDDDYIDPRITGVIRRYEVLHRNVDAISWECMSYQWPDNRPVPTLASIPVSNGTQLHSMQTLGDRLYRWSERRRSPSVGVGIYHGAIRRSLMERIKEAYGGRYFEHPNVDWENTCKVTAQARLIVHSERPFSVLGACAASNSAANLSSAAMKLRVKTFEHESRDCISLNQPSFPFLLSAESASLCLSIAATTAWFCNSYGIDLTGFGENYAHAAMEECKYSPTRENYDAKVASFAHGFAQWEGGKWARLFAPAPFSPPKTVNQLTGLTDDRLQIREADIGATTPAEFYRFGEHAIMPVEALVSGAKVFAP